jgi:hypothetical protein
MFGLPEDILYDAETRSSNIRLYFCVSNVQSVVLWMNDIVKLLYENRLALRCFW